jgi:UDP-N-acetylglucosamine acyltransferase
MKAQMPETLIHPTAIIHPQAELGQDVVVGPYSIIEANVKIGDGTRIGPRVTVEGYTTLGRNNEVFTGAVIGSLTQDKKFTGGKTFLKIGDNNKIREYVTINPGTQDGTETVIGNDNLIMAYAHVAHDCIIGNKTTLANGATLAGHVVIEDRAILGGLCGVHQFVRIGYLAIVGGCSKAVQDIPPFMMVDGHPAKAYGLNTIGLDRAEVPSKEKLILKKAFKILFRSGWSVKSAIKQMENEFPPSPTISTLLEFLRKSERGICG